MAYNLISFKQFQRIINIKDLNLLSKLFASYDYNTCIKIKNFIVVDKSFC